MINDCCLAQAIDSSKNVSPESDIKTTQSLHSQTQTQINQNLMTDILTVTGNTVNAANQYLTFSTYILAIFAIILTALGVALQIIGFREKKRYLIKIANNFSQDEDIQNTFVEKVLQAREIKDRIRAAIDSAVRIEVARAIADYISSEKYNETMNRLMGVIKDE